MSVLSDKPGTFCPATMCPLFARDGSPWTKDRDALCAGPGCSWWGEMGAKPDACGGCVAARVQVDHADRGRPVLQLGPVRASRERTKPSTFDCPRAAVCQWQREAGEGKLCPPREALARGLDPRVVAY